MRVCPPRLDGSGCMDQCPNGRRRGQVAEVFVMWPRQEAGGHSLIEPTKTVLCKPGIDMGANAMGPIIRTGVSRTESRTETDSLQAGRGWWSQFWDTLRQ